MEIGYSELKKTQSKLPKNLEEWCDRDKPVYDTLAQTILTVNEVVKNTNGAIDVIQTITDDTAALQALRNSEQAIETSNDALDKADEAIEYIENLDTFVVDSEDTDQTVGDIEQNIVNEIGELRTASANAQTAAQTASTKATEAAASLAAVRTKIDSLPTGSTTMDARVVQAETDITNINSTTPKLVNDDTIFSIEDENGYSVIKIGTEYFKIGTLFNVSFLNQADGKILKRVNGVWVASDNISSISELVDMTSVNYGDILTYVNGEWKPYTMSAPSVINSSDSFSIEDESGMSVVKADETSSKLGVFTFDKSSGETEGDVLTLVGGKYIPCNQKGDWNGKILATYGDSVTAINNGDWAKPYTINGNTCWGNYVANYFGMSKHYGRGIGGQMFRWDFYESGGVVSFVSPNGNLINRLDGYSYDQWNALSTKVYPQGVTAEMIESGQAIPIRSCGCSWLHITKMFPESIKDTIDVITLMYHNDMGTGVETTSALEWKNGYAKDTEWAASAYYSTYGGDYNITCTRGGIASTIMKLQAWMPQAIIVLCTPISGYGTSGSLNPALTATGMQTLADVVRDMSKLMSIPLIDVYSTDGINGLNRTTYISDGIHPYLTSGKKAVARSIIGGMKNIIPNL